MAPPQSLALVYEDGQQVPYLPDRHHEYMEWFFNNRIYIVFPNQNSEEILSQTVPKSVGDVANLGYVSDAVLQARARSRLLKQTAKGISMMKTHGQKAFGLMLLENSRDVLSDLGHIALWRAMLERTEVPSDLRNINISDDYPNQYPIYTEVTIPESAMHDDPLGIFELLQNITIDRRTIGDGGASASRPNLSRRIKK